MCNFKCQYEVVELTFSDVIRPKAAWCFGPTNLYRLKTVFHSILWKQGTPFTPRMVSCAYFKTETKTFDVYGELTETLYINVGLIVRECVWCLSSCSQASLVYIWYEINWIPPVRRSNTNVIDQIPNIQVLLQITYFGFWPSIILIFSINIIIIIIIAANTKTTRILNTLRTTKMLTFSLHT